MDLFGMFRSIEGNPTPQPIWLIPPPVRLILTPQPPVTHSTTLRHPSPYPNPLGLCLPTAPARDNDEVGAS